MSTPAAAPATMDYKIAWDEGAVNNQLANMSVEADLLFILNNAEVTNEYQAKLTHAGFKTVKKLRALGETRAAVTALMKTAFDLDAAKGLSSVLELAGIHEAWETAQTYVETKKVKIAHDRLKGVPENIEYLEYERLKSTFESSVGGCKIHDNFKPGTNMMERILMEIERGQFMPIPLDEVVTQDEEDAQAPNHASGSVEEDLQGRLMINRVGRKIKAVKGMPTCPETFRNRIKVLAFGMGMIKFKASNQKWLSSCTLANFATHADHMLGEDVKGLEPVDAFNKPVCEVPWALVMSYEFQIRKAAAKYVNTSRMDFWEAMTKATDDENLKTRHLTQPLSISVNELKKGNKVNNVYVEPSPRAPNNEMGKKAMKRERQLKAKEAADRAAATAWVQPKKGKGKGKGKGKDKASPKGKGKGKKNNGVVLHSETPDGQMICYGYQDGRCKGSCGRVHCCQVCFDVKHGYPDCAQWKAANV